MSIKIKCISIKGIRGAKAVLEIPTAARSVVLYGDNGTGKSSISDAIEWFLTDKVSHLSGNREIDLKEALRNSNLDNDDVSEVSIEYSDASLNSTKRLFYKKGTLVCDNSNDSQNFKDYISTSEKENLLLRYQFLTGFIDNTKSEKLKYLSDIIGFTEVTKKKEVLLKCYNSIKSELRNQNFETQISTQKQILIEKIGAAISQEAQLIDTLNTKIALLKTGIKIESFADIDRVLDHIKSPGSNMLVAELKFLESTNASLTNLKNEIVLFDREYRKYFDEFEMMASDVNAIMQTLLADLLKAGNVVLHKKYHLDSSCPLCLLPQDTVQLQSDIQRRIREVEESSQKKAKFDEAKESITNIVGARINRIDSFLLNVDLNHEDNIDIKNAVSSLRDKLSSYNAAAAVKITSGEALPPPEELLLTDIDFSIQEVISTRIAAINKILKEDNSAVVFSNISASKDAFLNIQKFERQKERLEVQRKSLEIIYNAFVKKQKEGLQNFITHFSGAINEFYQYMNPGEPFQEIQIITIGEDDELNGITIQYKYNGTWVSPPQKFFSESHLNCFGISFFLASVKAFNNKNKYIVLDDVISSFDMTHRKRFAELLFEKFSEYQIILLTHEKEWFTNIVTPLAKKAGWQINEIKWTEDKGTHFKDKPSELRDFILHQLKEGEIESIGNPMRKYLEHCLKIIASNIGAKLAFRFNESNEHRMPYELLMAIRSEIKQRASKELAAHVPLLNRIESSALLGNTLSHDNPITVSSGDINAVWADILELETVFNCQDSACTRPQVAMKNYDTVEKNIRCGCNMTKYDWKLN